MGGFRSQFHGPLIAACIVAAGAVLAALLLFARRRSERRPGMRQSFRVLAVGAAAVVVLATATPDAWPPLVRPDGDLVLQPGRGGLSEWRVLLQQPDSLAAVLLVANIALYVPLGFAARLGWQRTRPVLAAILTLSISVEVLQWRVLGRVGSTDDVLLNVAGGALGVLLACVVAAPESRSDRTPLVTE